MWKMWWLIVITMTFCFALYECADIRIVQNKKYSDVLVRAREQVSLWVSKCLANVATVSDAVTKSEDMCLVSRHGFSCLSLGSVSEFILCGLGSVLSFHVSSCLMSHDCVLTVFGDCLEGKRENYQVCSVQYCAQQLCTVQCTHIWTDLTFLWNGFCLTGPISLCLDSFLYMYYCMHV